MVGDAETWVPGQHPVPVDSITTTCPPGHRHDRALPAVAGRQHEVGGLQDEQATWLLVRPCQPPGSSSRTPPPVSRPGSPEWAAGTVDQVIGGGSDGCSVRGTIRIVPVGGGTVEMTSGSPSPGASTRPATTRTLSPAITMATTVHPRPGGQGIPFTSARSGGSLRGSQS